MYTAIPEIQALHDAKLYSDLCNAAEARGARLAQLEDQFNQAALSGYFFAPAEFAPLVRDPITRRMRTASVGEVLSDSLDITGGPQLHDVLMVLADVAKGEPKAQEAAKNVFAAMAKAWVGSLKDEV